MKNVQLGNTDLEIIIEDNGKGNTTQITQNKTHDSKALKIINERLQLLNRNIEENIFIDIHVKGTKVRMILKVD